MFEEERHEQIVQLLKGGRMVSVGEIAKQLFVSEATVRRDLTALERAGVLRRVYGGAVLTSANRDVPLLMRETEAQEAKQHIGRIAAGLVHENDVIILDASSTVYSMIPYLKDFKNVVAITSGLKTALALGERHIKTYLTGGLMIDNSYSMIGGYARDMLETINADRMPAEPRPRRLRLVSWEPRRIDWWVSGVQLAGNVVQRRGELSLCRGDEPQRDAAVPHRRQGVAMPAAVGLAGGQAQPALGVVGLVPGGEYAAHGRREGHP